MRDLQKLNAYGDPLTTVEEVDALVVYMELSPKKRMYIQFRYARDTTHSLQVEREVQELVYRHLQQESQGLSEQSVIHNGYNFGGL